MLDPDEHKALGLTPDQFQRLIRSSEAGHIGPGVWFRYIHALDHPSLLDQLREVVEVEMGTHGWTQGSVAAGAGIDESIVLNLMNKKAGGLDLETIEKLVRYFRMVALPLSWLPGNEQPSIDKNIGKGRKPRSDKGGIRKAKSRKGDRDGGR